MSQPQTVMCRPRLLAVAVLAFALIATASGGFGVVSPSRAQPAPAEAPAAPALTKPQAAAQAAYDKAVGEFTKVLDERRLQIETDKKLPDRPGQALYLARNQVMSTYKDLTDAIPSRLGRPNKFGIPPAYFDADIEPLLDQYLALFAIMQAPPADAQESKTPFKDIVDLARAIARAKGLEGSTVDAAGRISLGIFFAETNGIQNIGNARSSTYKGSMQAGVAENEHGRSMWEGIRPRIGAIDPAVTARDAREAARVGKGDQRFNHWTAVRNGLMHSHAALFPEIPKVIRILPDQIDQMKVFQLIQIIPSPTQAALASGNFAAYRISDPRIMGYLRNNSIFTFGRVDRARTSATFREILDAMWLFTDKFERARARFEEIKAQGKG